MIRIGSLGLLLASVSAFANPALHEEEIAGPRPIRMLSVSSDLKADRIENEPLSGSSQLVVLREDHGALTPVVGLEFTTPSGLRVTDSAGVVSLPASCGTSAKFSVLSLLRNLQFSVENESGSGPFRLGAELSCEGRTRLVFKSDSDAGQALGIWQVAYRAREKLRSEVGLGFWTKPIRFSFPGDGDYYSWGTVHLTRGDHWDVVGHEMGHAIYDLAGLGGMGGGQHKIDECYSSTLALSEGWASFFSAWVSVDLDDADAKFEYMVPRRAPLRFETIPADVCAGQDNEWRVTGFFWDLVDLHRDSEQAEAPFGALWKAMEGSKVRDTRGAVTRILQSRVFEQSEISQIWRQNFLTTDL